MEFVLHSSYVEFIGYSFLTHTVKMYQSIRLLGAQSYTAQD